MGEIDDFLFQHSIRDNFRNNFIKQLKFYANTFTHPFNGSNLGRTSFGNSKFLNFDSKCHAPSLYITARSMISLNKSPSFKKKSSGNLYKSTSDPKLNFYMGPSAISLQKKSKSNIKDRECGKRLCPASSLLKVSSKIKPSSMNVLTSIEDPLCLKAKSPCCSGDKAGDDHMAFPSLHNQYYPDKGDHSKVNTSWGVTRISVYDNRFRIIEIFKTSSQKPSTDCGKLEAVFVIGPHAM